jgi:hypothetical protein
MDSLKVFSSLEEPLKYLSSCVFRGTKSVLTLKAAVCNPFLSSFSVYILNVTFLNLVSYTLYDKIQIHEGYLLEHTVFII